MAWKNANEEDDSDSENDVAEGVVTKRLIEDKVIKFVFQWAVMLEKDDADRFFWVIAALHESK